VWSRDGGLIAFASDRGGSEDGGYNCDLWVMNPSRPDAPTQVTRNSSHDDCPAWDAGGRVLYFRSNRGGHWNVWKITVAR
ncbi:MAG: TolB family protein, partial [Tepidisphaeraceae bacterium]